MLYEAVNDKKSQNMRLLENGSNKDRVRYNL